MFNRTVNETRNTQTSFLPHQFVTFLKNRLVSVDVALQVFEMGEDLNERVFVTTRRTENDQRGIDYKVGKRLIIVTQVSSFAVVARAVLLPASSIALLRDANQPSE